MPKSPNTHLKSPKSNLIKVKTSFKVKVSAQKIITTNNFVKEYIRYKYQYRFLVKGLKQNVHLFITGKKHVEFKFLRKISTMSNYNKVNFYFKYNLYFVNLKINNIILQNEY